MWGLRREGGGRVVACDWCLDSARVTVLTHTPVYSTGQYSAVSVHFSARPVLQLYLVLRAADITQEGDRGDNFNMSHNYQVTCLPLPAPLFAWDSESGRPVFPLSGCSGC